MSRPVPLSADGTPYQFKLNPFKTDYLDFVANHPTASPAEKELGPLGLVVLPELHRLLIEIRAVYSQVKVRNQPCYTLCIAGLLLIFEHIVLLMADKLLGHLTQQENLKDLIERLAARNFLDEADRKHLHEIRKLRNKLVHRHFKHTQMDGKAEFLGLHSKLMQFLESRFITGGTARSKIPFIELKGGAYYIKPGFESDQFVQKFWLPRCVPVDADVR